VFSNRGRDPTRLHNPSDTPHRLHLYKNATTRRYLRLDSHGHAYSHVDGEYRIHHSPADAIDDLRPPGPINGPSIGQHSVTGTFVGGDTLVP